MIIELRGLCADHCTVPTSYQLEGVTKEGDCPQRICQETEIWKGGYNGEVAMLKVFRGPRDYHVQKTKSVSTLSDPRAEGNSSF